MEASIKKIIILFIFLLPTLCFSNPKFTLLFKSESTAHQQVLDKWPSNKFLNSILEQNQDATELEILFESKAVYDSLRINISGDALNLRNIKSITIKTKGENIHPKNRARIVRPEGLRLSNVRIFYLKDINCVIKDLIIDGNGTRYTCGLSISSVDSVVIENCLITNIFEGISFFSSKGQIINCIIEHCKQVDSNGGGMYIGDKADLEIIDSIFRFNEAQEGGGILANDCTVKILNSQFYGNFALNGSDICNKNDAVIELENTECRKNYPGKLQECVFDYNGPMPCFVGASFN